MIVTNDHDAVLIMDGREVLHLNQWDVVRVTKSDVAFRLVTFDSMNFYEAFRTKFNFKIRPDAVPSRYRPPA